MAEPDVTAARSRSPPVEVAGCPTWNRRAARATREPRSRHRVAAPSRQGRAPPGDRTPLHQTISRTRAAAALPSVKGGPGCNFHCRFARVR
jgi:hypothetical protein